MDILLYFIVSCLQNLYHKFFATPLVAHARNKNLPVEQKGSLGQQKGNISVKRVIFRLVLASNRGIALITVLAQTIDVVVIVICMPFSYLTIPLKTVGSIHSELHCK